MEERKSDERGRNVCPVFLDCWQTTRRDPHVLARRYHSSRRGGNGPEFPRIDEYDSKEPATKHPCKCGSHDAWVCWNTVRRHVLLGSDRVKGVASYPSKFEGAISRAAKAVCGDYGSKQDYEDVVQHLRSETLGCEKVSPTLLLKMATVYQLQQTQDASMSRDEVREKLQDLKAADTSALNIKGSDNPSAPRWAKGAFYHIIAVREDLVTLTSNGSLMHTTNNSPATIELNPNIRGEVDWGQKGEPCFSVNKKNGRRLRCLWEPAPSHGKTYRAPDSLQGDYGLEDLGYVKADYFTSNGHTERKEGHGHK